MLGDAQLQPRAAQDGKRPINLSITHMLSAEEVADLDVGQAR